jgi:hypothetical protein
MPRPPKPPKKEPKTPPPKTDPPVKQSGSIKKLAQAAGMDVNTYVQLVLRQRD